MSCALLWGLGGGLHGGLGERGPIADLQPTESQAAYAHALDRCRLPTNKVAHATDLPVAPLGEREAQLRLVQPLDARRPDRLVVEASTDPLPPLLTVVSEAPASKCMPVARIDFPVLRSFAVYHPSVNDMN